MLENRDDGANPRHMVENDASNRSLMVGVMLSAYYLCGVSKGEVQYMAMVHTNVIEKPTFFCLEGYLTATLEYLLFLVSVDRDIPSENE